MVRLFSWEIIKLKVPTKLLKQEPGVGLRVETLLWPSDHQSVTTGLVSQISTTVSKKTKQKVEPPTNNLPSKYLQNLRISKVQPAQLWQANEDFFFVFSITYPFLSARKKIIYIYIYISTHIYRYHFIHRKKKKKIGKKKVCR